MTSASGPAPAHARIAVAITRKIAIVTSSRASCGNCRSTAIFMRPTIENAMSTWLSAKTSRVSVRRGGGSLKSRCGIARATASVATAASSRNQRPHQKIRPVETS